MRGVENKQARMILTTLSPEQRVPADHPIRTIKAVADRALAELSPIFDEMYSQVGRPSIPPERLLKASVLMALYTIRSERQFCEQLDYNLLFRWFLDMDLEEPSFDHSTFSRNRERLLDHDVARSFFQGVVAQARQADLMSSDHFTVDGTLIDAWASMKSLRPKGEDPQRREPPDDPGNPTVDWRGERRSNDTHRSTTDPEARLARKGKGKEARLSYHGHALMENRNGLLVDLRVSEATGTAERDEAITMLDEALPGSKRITLAADRGYDTRGFVRDCRERGVTPHVARNTKRPGGSAIDERTTRHEGYRISQRIRKRVEEGFGWIKQIGNFRRSRYRGVRRTQHAAYLVAAGYNLVRMSRLLGAPT